MKFTANSNGHMVLDLGAKSCTTTGNGVFAALFGGGDKNDKKSIKDLENQGLNGNIELFIDNSISMDIDVDEFKELSVFCKEEFGIQKDNAKFLYNGVKKCLDDLLYGIKTRGSEIIEVIGNLNKYYLIKKAEVTDLDKDLKKKDKDIRQKTYSHRSSGKPQ